MSVVRVQYHMMGAVVLAFLNLSRHLRQIYLPKLLRDLQVV